MLTVHPVTEDSASAVVLLREALAARGPRSDEAIPWRSTLEKELLEGTAHGLLFRHDGRAAGLALWDPGSPVGATVEVAYLAAPFRLADGYRQLFSAVREAAGAVAFAPGGLAGLSAGDERALMHDLGFARFARSEMRLPSQAFVPPAPDGIGALRSVRPDDRPSLARLHHRAYSGRFDQYLFLEDEDPVHDAELAVQELLGGRWGEFLPWASPVAMGDEGPAGAVLVVRASYGPLIADVMVDPALQGRGLGRRLMVETIRRLRERGESVIVLNVTEGNAPAVALYERLGFVRTLGPAFAWYATDRIPVASGVD